MTSLKDNPKAENDSSFLLERKILFTACFQLRSSLTNLKKLFFAEGNLIIFRLNQLTFRFDFTLLKFQEQLEQQHKQQLEQQQQLE